MGSHCQGQTLMLLGLVFHQVDTISSDQRVHVRTERMNGKFLTSPKCWQLRCLCVDFGLLSCQVSDGGPDHIYIMNRGRRDKNMSLRLLEGSVYPSRVGDRLKKTLQEDSKGQPVSRFMGFPCLGQQIGRPVAIFPLHALSQFPHSVGKIPFSSRPMCFSPVALPLLWSKVPLHTSAQVTATVSLWCPLYLNRREPARSTCLQVRPVWQHWHCVPCAVCPDY